MKQSFDADELLKYVKFSIDIKSKSGSFNFLSQYIYMFILGNHFNFLTFNLWIKKIKTKTFDTTANIYINSFHDKIPSEINQSFSQSLLWICFLPCYSSWEDFETHCYLRFWMIHQTSFSLDQFRKSNGAPVVSSWIHSKGVICLGDQGVYIWSYKPSEIS